MAAAAQPVQQQPAQPQGAAAGAQQMQQPGSAGGAVAGQVNGMVQGAATEKVFDCFGNEVRGTSIRVHNPPGGKSSITF